jgi:tRNA pseudouridine32 synthase/23S rRNA pseudouridine746 synthase
MVALARAGGLNLEEQGLGRAQAQRGLKLGVITGLPLAALMVAGARIAPMRRFYMDTRIRDAGPTIAMYETFVRIPLATAAAEEVMFRGALDAVLRRQWSGAGAAAAGAGLFGLWHVLPTLRRLREEHLGEGGIAGDPSGVATAVGVTAAAGLALSWLRHRSGSVLAPALAHAAVNAGGYAGAWLTRARSTPGPAVRELQAGQCGELTQPQRHRK